MQLCYRRVRVTEGMKSFLLSSYDSGGFDEHGAQADLGKTLSASLTELSTHAVTSIKGYIFVDGKSDAIINQICERYSQPICFVSASGLDFCTRTTTLLESRKYFVDQGETEPIQSRFRGFLPHGENDLRDRIRSLYRLIFQSFAIQGCKNICLLPLGLGVFLENVDRALVPRVVEIYLEAQLGLLCGKEAVEYGFDNVWFNPGRFGRELTNLVTATPQRFRFQPTLIIHKADNKFLAVELARRNMCGGMLNPSDCIAVMQGRVGYYWETGRQSRYVGEEDLAATSTILLQHYNVSPALTLQQIFDSTDAPSKLGTRKSWVPALSPHGFSHFQKLYGN